MPVFKHPTTTVEVEGTYIVKDTILSRFVYLSEKTACSDDTELFSHEKIMEKLSNYGVDPDQLDFTVIGSQYSYAFLDA